MRQTSTFSVARATIGGFLAFLIVCLVNSMLGYPALVDSLRRNPWPVIASVVVAVLSGWIFGNTGDDSKACSSPITGDESDFETDGREGCDRSD
ncbi:hypothetical protein [Roseiconus lacunae]|uniref:Holin n=1 Tax=Roseiconus lacunae TaxID=2605694 RepID=A0ABT7PS34_9BACT|nr:hypothetical protein [Roseiconus lacunae]MDM4019312.1 hypothetical protein [Roseiconus lacunae]